MTIHNCWILEIVLGRIEDAESEKRKRRRKQLSHNGKERYSMNFLFNINVRKSLTVRTPIPKKLRVKKSAKQTQQNLHSSVK